MEKKSNILTYILVGLLIFSFFQYNKLQKKNERLTNQVSSYEDALDDANSNIEEANSTIEDLNSGIENAQGYAWSTYDDMGSAIDDLTTGDTVDTVSAP